MTGVPCLPCCVLRVRRQLIFFFVEGLTGTVLYCTVGPDKKEGNPDFLGGKKEGKKGDISLFHFVLKCVVDMHLDDRFLHHFYQSMPQKVYP